MMRVKLIILILQTLKHFNNTLNNIKRATTNLSGGAYYKDIDKKLTKEIEYQESKLVK